VRIIDGIPTPFKTDMENRKTNHRTELTIESIIFGRGSLMISSRSGR